MKDITELKNKYQLIQDKVGFRLTVDSVILADFVDSNLSDKNILDVGTGNGIIPILLSMREDKNVNITGIEIQEDVSKLAHENIIHNNLCDKIKIINIDVNDFKLGNTYDVVISNPPYMKVDGKKQNDNEGKSIARHEIKLDLKSLISNAKRLLKPIGEFYMVHRTHRLDEIVVALNEASMSIQKIRFVYASKEEESSNLILIKAVKGKKSILEVVKPLYLKENGY